jgi:hypothetical protein
MMQVLLALSEVDCWRRSRAETSARGAKTRRTAKRDRVKAEEQRRHHSCHGLRDGPREVERGAHYGPTIFQVARGVVGGC